MCDLIDLNSPDTKGMLGAKLASPLIPVPTDAAHSNHNSRVNESSSLIMGKRDSLENNPFDMVLHKTTEYIQKKDDPFEVALEKALNPKNKKSITTRTCSVDLTSELTPKRKRHPQIFKMNRTLDESHIEKDLDSWNNQKKITFNTASGKYKTDDFNTVDVAEENFETDSDNFFSTRQSNDIPTIDIQNADLSILNQSVMNDSLSETNCGTEKEKTKTNLLQRVLTRNQKDMFGIEELMKSNMNLKVPHHRRCFSQGGKVSPKKTNHASHLSSEISGTDSLGGCSIISSIASSNSLLNDGFLKSRSSLNSVYSSLSNISAITRLNSVSSGSSYSMAMSSGILNRSFMESCSSDKIDDTKLCERTNSAVESNPELLRSSICLNSAQELSDKSLSISKLTNEFHQLKAKSQDITTPKACATQIGEATINSSNTPIEPITSAEAINNENDTNSKLIDVDVFTPPEKCSKNLHKDSISDTSSDSVFTEENKINRSIFHEAKVLARTFEELALKTSSGSSIDDLMSSNPLWTSELLPAFDDEAMVDNLIELPQSPNVNTGNGNINNKDENANHENGNKIENCVNGHTVDDGVIKDLEDELIKSVQAENKITAATLLLDLKKIIKGENNVEANKLLDNLEKVLGVECKNNTELLTTYLNTTNDLAKVSVKSNVNSDIIKNIENNMEQSQEENLRNDTAENVKESVSTENINLTNSDINKCFNNSEKNLNQISIGSGFDSPEKDITDNSLKTNTEVETPSDRTSKNVKNDTSDEKFAIDLLTNLGKLLNGQAKEQSTVDLLKNLGKLLNLATNSYNCNVHNNPENDNICTAIQQTPRKSKLKPENKVRLSMLSKSENRLSLDLDARQKTSGTNALRRSASTPRSPPIKAVPSPVSFKEKNTSQFKEVKKRFPSDPGFINMVSNKKNLNTDSDIAKIPNSRKDTQTKPTPIVDLKKEKPSTVGVLVKNRLKKKSEAEAIEKKGPMKAVIPIGNMHKRESVSRKISSSTGSITPPKLHKMISSTPNPTDSESVLKKCPRSKPVASSTPDAQNSKTRTIQTFPVNNTKKRNFSCDISPVTNITNKNGIKESPKKANRLPSPKKLTPKLRQADSNIPKILTSPVIKRSNTSFDLNQQERQFGSPQRSMKKEQDKRRNSPTPLKRNSEKLLHSPLRDNNKLSPKVKPLNLISKLRRQSNSNYLMEKENNFV